MGARFIEIQTISKQNFMVWYLEAQCHDDTHDRRQFGDVDRIITVKDGHVFEGEHIEQVEVTI